MDSINLNGKLSAGCRFLLFLIGPVSIINGSWILKQICFQKYSQIQSTFFNSKPKKTNKIQARMNLWGIGPKTHAQDRFKQIEKSNKKKELVVKMHGPAWRRQGKHGEYDERKEQFKQMNCCSEQQQVDIQMKNVSQLGERLDRLSIRDVLSGRTGSVLGMIGSLVLIVLCLLFFVGPVSRYWQGDYIHSSFKGFEEVNNKQYSGYDFKMAISWLNRKTGEPVDHSLLNLLNSQVLIWRPKSRQYKGPLRKCSPDYFPEMGEEAAQFTDNTCFTIPDGIEFYTKISRESSHSLIGFEFTSVCHNPFTCVSSQSSSVDETILHFFKENYFVVYFTSTVMNQRGEPELFWNRVFSSEWSGRNTVIPFLYIFGEYEQLHLDNSIMPWFNEQTLLHQVWYGKLFGVGRSEDTVGHGTGALLSIIKLRNVSFREYRKLDWLIGMLSGGSFLLYLFFYTLCSPLNITKQKINTCKAMLLTYETDTPDFDCLKPVSISWFYYLVDWMPFQLPLLSRDRALIQQSEQMLDIVGLVKKQKVAIRNLSFLGELGRFSKKRLVETEESIGSYNNKFEMMETEVQLVQEDCRIPEAYATNSSMMILHDSQAAKEGIQNNEEYQKYQKTPEHSSRDTICEKILNLLSSLIVQCDVFGCRPNLISTHSSSLFGVFITALIIVLGVLTFALTLGNMSKTKITMDKIYERPEDHKVDMVTGQDFRMAICLSKRALTDQLIGENKFVDIKFYQYSRSGSQASTREMQVLQQDSPYFQGIDSSQKEIDMSFCLRPRNGENLTVAGSDQTDKQEYFGAHIRPFCAGDAEYCKENKERIKEQFNQFLNNENIMFWMTSNRYHPGRDVIIPAAVGSLLTPGLLIRNQNYQKSIEHSVKMEVLQLIDDRKSWVFGQDLPPVEETLSDYMGNIGEETKSIQSDSPSLRVRVMSTGSIQRIFLRNYKLDFLLATVGGCLAFYFFIFSCCGTAFNRLKYQTNFAATLYLEDSTLAPLLSLVQKYLNLPYCKDPILAKVHSDLDAVSLAQRIDNAYHLSSSGFSSLGQKNLSLLFMKKRIREDGKDSGRPELELELEPEDEVIEENYDDFDLQEEVISIKEKELSIKRKSRGSNSIANVSEDLIRNEVSLQKKSSEKKQSMEVEPIKAKYAVNRNRTALHKVTSYLDMFKTPSTLTLDGKRVVKSHCGGICTLILLFCAILLTQHFLTLYFSNFHLVSNERVLLTHQDQRNLIELETGKNFKFMVFFIKHDDFNSFNVSEYVQKGGLSLVAITLEKGGQNIEEKYYNLVECPSDYLEGQITEYDDLEIFKDIRFAYCAPDGLKLRIKGSPLSEKMEYFKFYLHQNDPDMRASEILRQYNPRFHYTTVHKNFNTHEIQHHLDQFMTVAPYLTDNSVTHNVTLAPTQIRYDTAVNPNNELPTITTYEVVETSTRRYSDVFKEDLKTEFELVFVGQNYLQMYTVRKIKVNELFGLIGGAIIFLFIGFGFLPRLFNEFRMLMIVARSLHFIRGQELAHPGELSLLATWLLSFMPCCFCTCTLSRTLAQARLLRERVNDDLSLTNFYKRLQTCESSIQNKVALPRLYAKKVVNPAAPSKTPFQKDTLNDQIRVANIVNNFSDWDLNAITQAKKQAEEGQQVQCMCGERWLDKYFGLNRNNRNEMSSILASSLNFSSGSIRLEEVQRSRRPLKSNHDSESLLFKEESLAEEKVMEPEPKDQSVNKDQIGQSESEDGAGKSAGEVYFCDYEIE